MCVSEYHSRTIINFCFFFFGCGFYFRPFESMFAQNIVCFKQLHVNRVAYVQAFLYLCFHKDVLVLCGTILRLSVYYLSMSFMSHCIYNLCDFSYLSAFVPFLWHNASVSGIKVHLYVTLFLIWMFDFFLFLYYKRIQIIHICWCYNILYFLCFFCIFLYSSRPCVLLSFWHCKTYCQKIICHVVKSMLVKQTFKWEISLIQK